MIPTQLIVVDGPWGSGKTTTLQVLCLHLRSLGLPIRTVLDDTSPHPLWDETRSDPNTVVAQAVRRWTRFVGECAQGKRVTLLESGFLNGTGQGFVEADLSRDDAARGMLRITEIARPLDPILIYLRPDDLPAAWRRAREERGPDWVAFMEREYGPLGARLGYPTLGDYYRALVEAYDEAFRRFDLRKVRLGASAAGWEQDCQRAAAFLGLPDIPFAPATPEDFVGTYRAEAGLEECSIVLEGQRLVIFGAFSAPRSLLPDIFSLKKPPIGAFDRFANPGMTITRVAFERNPDHRVTGMLTAERPYGAPEREATWIVWNRIA